eukprot:365661-Chlamydomonas_euryale.AAC.18
MLEAAFDGEDAVLQTLLERAKALGMKNYVDAADAHGNTILSEAAAGKGMAIQKLFCSSGTLSTVQLLLDSGADPNTRGEFARTPLWRACFLGKAEVVMPLLRAGADPRIGNHQVGVMRLCTDTLWQQARAHPSSCSLSSASSKNSKRASARKTSAQLGHAWELTLSECVPASSCRTLCCYLHLPPLLLLTPSCY